MSRIESTSEISKSGVTLEFPRTDEFAQQFIGYVPEFICLITIYRGHLTQPDETYATYWRGRVGGAKSDGKMIILAGESIFTSLRRYGLRARYTRTCRHMLYRGGCRLDKEDFGSAGTVTAATENTLTATVFGAQTNGYWIGGMVEAADGALRYIVDHGGTTITVWRPIQSILDALPAPITVYPGCNKSVEHCRDKFNNLVNYGGFPLLPQRNPFDGRSIL